MYICNVIKNKHHGRKRYFTISSIPKTALKIVIEDDELRELNAKNAKLVYDSYIAVGFQKSEAIELVAASMRNIK